MKSEHWKLVYDWTKHIPSDSSWYVCTVILFHGEKQSLFFREARDSLPSSSRGQWWEKFRDILLMLWSQIVNHHIIKLDTELFISTERRIIQNKGLYLLLWNTNDLWVFWWVKYPHFMSDCGNSMSLLSVSVSYIVLYMKWHVKGWPVYLWILWIDRIALFA